MHEEVDFTGLLLALAIVVLVSLGFVHHVRLQAVRQVEVRKLQQILAAESERAEEEAVEEYSMFATRNLCAVCSTPTKTRCSRCKSVHYCSAACQVDHWRQGHKNECRKDNSIQQAETRDKPVTTVHTEAIKQPLQGSHPVASTNHVQEYAKASEDVQVRRRKVDIPNATSDGCLAKPRKILFPYERFVKFYYKFDGQRPPCGLINCGNSCFANVILQCLTYTRPLAAFLLEGTHRRECRRNDWCFMCELQEHVWRVFNSQIPFSPIRILSRLRNIGNHLGYGRQEDAHEFMRFAIDSMQSTCLDEFGGEKAVDPRSQETTLIQYIFGGHLQSQVKCMKCGHESNRYENLMDLAVEIQGAVESLQDGLAQFTAPEWLDGENKYKCDRCNAYVKASKRLTIHEAPNILTIALKRFQSGKFGKLNKRVTFPEALDMSPYISGGGDKPPIYRLYAVVVHVDMLNASFFGHYICYVRGTSGTWYKVDDSKVKEVDLDKVLAQKAYMLMYSRSSVRPGPEADTGSLASSLTDVSVSRSTLPCKYQQKSSSVGQVHSELHQVSPVVAGTLVCNRLVEDTGAGCSSDKDVAGSISGSPSIEGSVPDEDGRYRRKAGKRRLDEEQEHSTSSSSSLSRSRSSSCPPVGRSQSAPKDGYELADDLPRTFGYSLCARDRDGDWHKDMEKDRNPSVVASHELTPTKRQHLLDLNGRNRLMVGADEFRGEVIDGNEPKSSNSSSHCSTGGGGEKVGNFVEVLPEQVMGARLEDKPESTAGPASSSRSRSKISRNSSSSSCSSEQGDEAQSSLRPVFAKGFLNRRLSEAGCS